MYTLWVITRKTDQEAARGMGFVSSKGDSVRGQSSQELAPVLGKKNKAARVTGESGGLSMFHSRFWDTRGWAGSSAIAYSHWVNSGEVFSPTHSPFTFSVLWQCYNLFSYSRYNMESVSATHILEFSWKKIKLVVTVTFRFVTSCYLFTVLTFTYFSHYQKHAKVSSGKPCLSVKIEFIIAIN